MTKVILCVDYIANYCIQDTYLEVSLWQKIVSNVEVFSAIMFKIENAKRRALKAVNSDYILICTWNKRFWRARTV